MITGELKSQVDKIWDVFASGGVSNPISVIEQFTFLLFIRRLDERQLKEEANANLLGTEMEVEIFTPGQKALRWHSFKNVDPETMLDLFTKPMVEGMSVFEHMKTAGKHGGVFAEFLAKATFIITTARLLDQVVQLIDQIKMEDQDTKGDLYEYMLGKIASAGRNGQFRTPRHIIAMMVALTKPNKEDIICDPSSGTSGFLVGASEYYRDHHPDWFLEKGFTKHFDNNMFHGIEIDDTMIRIGAMNLQLHGVESPNLIKDNSLGETLGHIRNQYSLILANPPFKGALDYDAVEGSILKTVKSKKTELLFLGLMLRMMKIGGRAAVVVPDGVLFGSSNAHKQIRQELIEKHKLDAIISMPSGVFKPYAGVSTAVIFFTKTGSGGTDTVWFYDMEADGYSLDDKRTKIKENDIPDVLNRYHNLTGESERARTDKSFLVPFDEIKDNDWDLSINRYKEIVYEEIEYAAPSDIIKDIESLDQERNQALAALKEMLG
jgi:type I restriction enzyme M protein